jgi:hypothetical protein
MYALRDPHLALGLALLPTLPLALLLHMGQRVLVERFRPKIFWYFFRIRRLNRSQPVA